jgi:hypothetical protein
METQSLTRDFASLLREEWSGKQIYSCVAGNHSYGFAQKVSKPVREAVSEPGAVATGSVFVENAQHYTISDSALSSAVTRSLPLPVLILG